MKIYNHFFFMLRNKNRSIPFYMFWLQKLALAITKIIDGILVILSLGLLSLELGFKLIVYFMDQRARASLKFHKKNVDIPKPCSNAVNIIEKEPSTKDVRCNNCEWTGKEEDLLLLPEKGDGFFKACPNCITDEYLEDIEPEPQP